jgi:hypothetical protein
MGRNDSQACQIVTETIQVKKYKSLKPEIMKKNLKIVLNQHFLHS